MTEPETGGLSPPLIHVVNDRPEDYPGREGLQERHIIPFVPDIFRDLKAESGVITVWPPRGLLKLGKQQLLLDVIAPRLLVRLNFYQPSTALVPSYTST